MKNSTNTTPSKIDGVTGSSLRIRKLKRWLRYFGVSVLMWPFCMAFYQDVFWSFLLKYFIAAIILAFIIDLFVHFKKGISTGIAGLFVILALVWFYVGAGRSGSTLFWDIVIFGVAGAIAGVVYVFLDTRFIQRLTLDEKQKRRIDDVLGIALIIFAWFAISVTSFWRSDRLPVDTARFVEIASSNLLVPEVSSLAEERKIGLALSGGGYRAAIFHAGVLHALESLGIVPHALSTVSGGSIIGAYYAIGGNPSAFRDAAKQKAFHLKRELILFHNAVRLPFPWAVPGAGFELWPWYDYNRGDVQASMLRRLLYNNASLTYERTSRQPLLLIATSDLTYGMLFGFTSDGTVITVQRGQGAIYREEVREILTSLDLAEYVATSGAFPIAFPAQQMKLRIIPEFANGSGVRTLSLADGGIGDNSGMLLLRATQDNLSEKLEPYAMPSYWRLDAIMQSDAGAIFGVSQEIRGIEALSRAFDVAALAEGKNRPKERAVTYSPRFAYTEPEKQFLRVSNDVEKTDDEQWRARFPIYGLPAPILKKMAQLLPEHTQKSATDALNDVLGATNDMHLNCRTANNLQRKLSRIKSAAECTSSVEGLCEAAQLRDAIRSYVENAFRTFQRTSTLEDQITEIDVETLFRLGQFLVYFKWQSIERALKGVDVSVCT